MSTNEVQKYIDYIDPTQAIFSLSIIMATSATDIQVWQIIV